MKTQFNSFIKKICLPGLMLFILMIGKSSQAQPQGKRDDIEAMRIGFITQQLDLTTDEAKVFWPVYNKYHDEMEVLRKDRATELLSAKVNFDSMTDDEASKLIDNEFNSRQKEIDIQRKYNVEFKKVLPVKKVAKLYRAEQLFKIKLISEMKQPPAGRGADGPPPPRK
ncbi:MAG: hypothetical protein K1X63_10460 [Chitinophagales bacterium]|nr:hypothetical protein [Chitinophagales bacterium]